MSVFDFLFGKMIDKRISAYQSDLIKKHCEEVENIYKQMRGWRHDYHNHIQTLLALTGKTDEKVISYLHKLNDDLSTVDTVIKTGNVMVDAILNSKISLAKESEIIVNAKATVPNELKISEIDLCVIIGNLIDNARESSFKVENKDGRIIRIFIGVLKNQLYISVANSVGGQIIKDGRRYFTTKNKLNHGFGIMRIDKIVEKNKGFVNRQNEDDFFVTEVLLPI